MKLTRILATLALAVCYAHGQGTFQIDQSINPTNAPGIFDNIQPDPTGESFVPALSSVGFVQLYLGDPTRVQAPILYIDLWSGSLTSGTLIGQSTPVSLSTTFVGIATFLFSSPVSVNPGTTYYLQAVIQSGDSEQIGIVPGPLYPNGMAFLGGVADPGGDLWFREGIVVPEPSSVSFALFGLAAIYPVLRRRNLTRIPGMNKIHPPCSRPSPKPAFTSSRRDKKTSLADFR